MVQQVREPLRCRFQLLLQAFTPEALAGYVPLLERITRRYLTNVLWTWGGVGVGIVSGFLVSPYTIRKLGDVNFSIWSLALSLVEYYWLIDFGLRRM